jgi:hypothetical protein
MDWNRFEASGRLHAFWKWCLKFAITGDLHKFSDAVLGRSVELNGDQAKRFVQAMTSDQSCWIDRGRGPNGESIFRVHDWPEFTSYYIRDSLFKRKPAMWAQVLEIYKVPIVRVLSRNSHGTVTELSAIPNLTNQPTGSLLGSGAEAPDPNLWPMRSEPVNPPVDPEWPHRIHAIHAWYCREMGSGLNLHSGLERQWFEWFKAGHDEDQFKRVFKYLRAQIKEKKRNEGALKLSNLLQADRFGEDLALATVQRKAIASAPHPVVTAPDKAPSSEAMARGAEQMKKLKETLTKGSP